MRKFIFAVMLLMGIVAQASVTVSVNGVNHTIPQTNEKGWGTNVTAWIQAISQYTLQPSGGTFTLTSEVNAGATYGFKVPYIKTATATPATAGVLRLANTDTLAWRNAANSSNLLLAVDASNNLTFNGNPVAASSALTASRALVSDGTGLVSASSVTATELGYVSGVTSALQTQINAKSPTASPTFTGIVTTPALTVSGLTATTVPYLDGSKNLTSSAITPTELSYVSGVTSAIQTQLGGKQSLSTLTTKGDTYVATASATVVRQGIGADGTVLTADSAQTNGLKWATAASAPDQSYEISNCTIATSVAGSALTVALKDKSGADASAGSPCKIGFRSATVATGTYSQTLVTAALSVVISSGSTLGCVNATPCILYVYAVNNAGTVVLAVGSGILADEGSVYTTTVLAGAGADDSGQVIYSTAAQTSKAIRLLGRINITEATAGTWASNATEIANQPFKQFVGTFSPMPTAAITAAAYSILLSDEVIDVDTTANAITLTLPTPVGIRGKRYLVTRTNSSANIVTLSGTGLSTKLQRAGEAVHVVSDGTNWKYLSEAMRTEIASISCSGASSVSSQSGNWISTAGNLSAGACTLTLPTGIFSSTPNCVATMQGSPGTATFSTFVNPSSATSVTIGCNAANSGSSTVAQCTGTNVFGLICSGAR